jgi:hypothetical protein
MDFFLLKSEVYFVLLSPLDVIIKQRYLYKSLKVGILNQYVKVNNLHQLPLPESHSLLCTEGARQREEYAQHRLCRAHFSQAHGKERPAHFYPVKKFAVCFGKRQHTAQFVVVRNT